VSSGMGSAQARQVASGVAMGRLAALGEVLSGGGRARDMERPDPAGRTFPSIALVAAEIAPRVIGSRCAGGPSRAPAGSRELPGVSAT
jgi:hypothetical protein